ncbi:MAG: S8 family serine peptidase [Xenococcaceae cyanobacterium MO_167.B27]|nr:S8 family serine peptidase [Xenococcaceae cyanobacterium MO_167.B27]
MATSDFDISTIIEQTPLFPLQWHLKNTGQTGGTPGADANILDAWSIATGEGVVIGIVDSSINFFHPDLNDNYNSVLSYGGINDGETHGTLVAGIAVGEGDNDIGIIGAAPDATFASLFLDFSSYNPLSHKNQEIDIYNNSWGPLDFQERIDNLNTIENSIQEGRGGLGNIYVFAAGNGGLEDNVNYDSLANSRYTIAVGAIDHNGERSEYSTPGASLLISGYSSNENVGIISTTNINDIGFFPGDSINGEYDTNFGGTSAAAPLVSGVIALMLEANPNLTWRDVQHILVETAELNDPDDPDWVKNGAGHDINYKYGFGGIDATAAVNAAVNWETVVEEVSLTSGLINVNSIIPDDNTVGISSSFTIEEDIDLEWVEVVFDADHIWRADLEIVLTSPDGTESILAEQRDDDDGDDYDNWIFTSARHWGESSQGEWILNISDEKSLIEGTWNSWQINLYGSDNLPTVDIMIDDITVSEDAENQTIDLSNVFSDADGDEITLAIQNNSNSELVTTTLDGNDLTLDFQNNQFGTADITILATANGQSVQDTFTLTVNPIDDAPIVANPIADVTVDEDADNQTIDLSNVFEDIDSENIQLEIASNSNSELVTPLLDGNDLTLDFLENQSGTADITIRATADGKSVEDTFTVTVNPTLETIELFRFRNTTFETGTYVFVGAAERDAILDNPDFNQTFELEGDGNPAFVASTESGDDLEGFYRLSSLDNPGTFLFVGQGEYDAIFAQDSDQRDRWERQGFDSEGNDIPEFYLYGVGANVGTAFNRFQNRANNTFLYAGPQETEAINSNPDFSAAFFDQGGAFEAF